MPKLLSAQPQGRRAYRVAPMATTISMPPPQVWGYLIQMGCDRGGFYSWDRLDNGGRPSARTVHPEWQDLAVGDRIAAAPDGSVSFEVVELDVERELVLRLSLRFPSARPFDVARERPRAFVDGVWRLSLRAAPGGATRLESAVDMTGRPRWLYAPLHLLMVRPAHRIMQTKQFAELRCRAEPRA